MGGLASSATDIPVFCTKDDILLMVNMNCVNRVITGVMRLCLEYAVQGDVDDTIQLFLQSEEHQKSKWFKINGYKYQHSYKELDTTNLMEIITKVTDIRNDCTNKDYLLLFKSLKDLKDFRNSVIHDKGVTYAEDTASRLCDKLNASIDRLGDLFGVESREIVSIKATFHKEIQEINAKDNRQINLEKITSAVKQGVFKEIMITWKQMMMKSTEFDRHPFGSRQIPMCAIFHELVFEVIADFDNPGGFGQENLETIVCTDILCIESSNIHFIEGDPGSGKSTILRMICHEFSKTNENSIFKSISHYSMMIPINCRDKDNICSFWQYFQTYYKEVAKVFQETYVISALRDLKMIIAIDGLDETNEASNALVRDVIHHFAGSKTVRFLITSRRGFTKKFVELFQKKALEYRVLNIMPMESIDEQENFISRVITQIPNINSEDILKTFREKQAELSSHFVRPLGLILFITLFDLFPDKVNELTHELSLMHLTYELHLENMTNRMSELMESCSSQWSRLFLKKICRYSLQWIQNSIYEIDHKNFNKLTDECFQALMNAGKEVNFDKNKIVSIESVISCIFLKRKCAETTITAMHDYFHRRQQEFLASTILTETLENTRSGSLMEILSDLTRENVEEQDLSRLVK